MRKSDTEPNLELIREKLYTDVYQLCKLRLERRLSDEGYSLTMETLNDTAERYADALIDTIMISSANLVENDLSNLRDIFKRINSKSL